MIDEATVDCYGEDEEVSGMLATLEDRLAFPFQAKVLGETVEVIGLDQRQSSERRGAVAKVRKQGRQYTIALADLEAVERGTETAEWLAAYRYWLGK
jgi:Calcium binding